MVDIYERDSGAVTRHDFGRFSANWASAGTFLRQIRLHHGSDAASHWIA